MGSWVKHIVAHIRSQRNRVLLAGLAIVLANAFVVLFVNHERYIYFWDYANYWDKYVTLGKLFTNSSLTVFKEVWRSIRHDTYNFLPVLVFAPFHAVLGSGRLTYVLLITNLYAIPAAFSCALSLHNLTGDDNNPHPMVAGSVLTVLTVLLMPQFWTPVLFGYVDVVGVLVINAILFIYFSRASQSHTVVWLVTLALLLAGLILLRRWYAFWVVAFFIAAALDRSLLFADSSRLTIRRYAESLMPVLLIGVASVIAFFVIATPIALYMVRANYADMYSAYKFSQNIVEFVATVANQFGALVVLLFLASAVECLLDKSLRQRAAFLLVTVLASVWLFSRTQDFTIQHYYLIVPSLVVFLSVWALKRYRSLTTRLARICFMVGYMIALLINFVVVFSPSGARHFEGLTSALSSERHPPLVREDIAEMKRLLNVLQELTGNGKASVYVLASSLILNDSIVRQAGVQFYPRCSVCDRLELSSSVDKRDGLTSFGLLRARWIVVADPIQYHLRPEDQKVIGIPAYEMLSGTGIGVSYERLPYEFELDKGVKVYIFEKVRPLQSDVIEAFSREFLKYYPDRPEFFAPAP